MRSQLQSMRARARPAPPGTMNKLETAWSEQLEAMKLGGDIVAWKYEPFTLILAKRTTYKPDFLVVDAQGFIEIHEVKGHWEDDARVKIKIAARQFPWFRFVGLRRARGSWEREEFTP